jgi:prepilin-type N-terminal cleavage/methylation domain-containing protein
VPKQPKRDAGFTMIELMMVVVVIGVLATIAVVSYTKYMRRAHAAEVPRMFGEIKVREEAYHGENGVYLSACGLPLATNPCTEADYWPAALPGRGNPIDITAGLPERWSALKLSIGSGALYCQYNAIAGAAGDDPTTLGANGQAVFGTFVTAGKPIPRDYYYLLAQCDWDNDPSVQELYTQRGDVVDMHIDNEGH